MPKEEWGVKRLCPTTGKRFYDLGKTPIVSPYTGDVVVLETGKNTRTAIKAETAAPKKAEAAEEEDTEVDVLEDDADVDLGDDVLDDDDDDADVSLDEIADVAADDDDS